MKIAFVVLITPVHWVGLVLLGVGTVLCERGLSMQRWVVGSLQSIAKKA